MELLLAPRRRRTRPAPCTTGARRRRAFRGGSGASHRRSRSRAVSCAANAILRRGAAMQRIFLTGASSGLGAGLARHYARPGATLGLVARRAAQLEQVARDVRAAGAAAHLYVADVADTDAMQEASRR